MKNIKVLILSHLFPSAQNQMAGIFVYQQVKALQKLGVDPIIIAPKPYIPFFLMFMSHLRKYSIIQSEHEYDGIQIYSPKYICTKGKLLYLVDIFSFWLGIFQCVLSLSLDKKDKFDLIHAYNILPEGFSGVWLSKLFRIPLICSALGSDVNYYAQQSIVTRWATSYIVKNSTHLTAVSQALAEKMNSIALPKKGIKVVYNGVDAGLFKPVEDYRFIRNELNVGINKFVFLYVGNIKKEKGIVELIDAFNMFAPDQDIELVLIGEGKLFGIGSNYRIKYLSKKNHCDIAKWMNACDVLVLPSYSEGFPNVVMEAFASGLPVLVSAVGGVSELVKDGVTGLLVKPRDPESLYQKMKWFLLNKPSAKLMGKNGHKLIFNQMTWENNAKEIYKLYDEVLNAKI